MMSQGKEIKSERVLFSIQAHVFHLDLKTKKTWLAVTSKAVPVSFFYDSTKNLYRILGIEGSKTAINSAITSNLSFRQTSKTFGHWKDVRANAVFGLGFASAADTTEFGFKFQQVTEAAKNLSPISTKCATSDASTNTSSDTDVQEQKSADEQKLKAENERLNLVIARNCANAKNSMTELTALKSDNNRLTSALKESTAKVSECKRQLHTCEEENDRMKRQIDAMKSTIASETGKSTANADNKENPMEIPRLKNHIFTLKKELHEVEVESFNSKSANKLNEQFLQRFFDLSDKLSKGLIELCDVQPEMEKIVRDHPSKRNMACRTNVFH